MLLNDSIEKGIAITALEQVYDPEIGLNVIDLGLIYNIDFDNSKNEIIVTMTLTTQMCPMGQSIQDNVKKTLEDFFNSYTIIVKLVFEPEWTYDNISEKGKEILNS